MVVDVPLPRFDSAGELSPLFGPRLIGCRYETDGEGTGTLRGARLQAPPSRVAPTEVECSGDERAEQGPLGGQSAAGPAEPLVSGVAKEPPANVFRESTLQKCDEDWSVGPSLAARDPRPLEPDGLRYRGPTSLLPRQVGASTRYVEIE